LTKNSWGSSWGSQGYFWISYYDKISGQHAEMGAVSFQNVVRNPFSRFYFHDYHGWRATLSGVEEAFNAFTAKGAASGKEVLKAVSFYTAVDNVEYAVRVYDRFEGGQLMDILSHEDGVIENTGFHTIDLHWPVTLPSGDHFYVYVFLSGGGHPVDRTSNVPVLLGANYRATVKSKASEGESFYKKNGQWVDLTKDEATSNFCIKAISSFN
jgi:hypothetical protein